MLDEVRKYVEITDEDLDKPLIFKKKDDLYFMILNKPKVNSFNHDQIRNIVACCDEIEESHGPACLITLSLNDKIFSGGIDLKYTSELGRIENIKYFILELIAMFGRVTMLNIPTIAVVKGACIAGGFMLTSSHDLVYVVDKAVFACN
jgi:enoyl-CoA hydratase/carnithine racemase